MNLTIRFAKSPSTYFKLALELAQRHKSFKEDKIGKLSIYQVTLTELDADLIDELTKLAGAWKSTRITANGKKISHYDVELALFCSAHYKCDTKKHWCNACHKFVDKKEKEITKKKVKYQGNVVELPVRIPID